MATRDRGSAPNSQGASDQGGLVRRLVIVESPTKARKIAPYLGRGYVVEASVGHIRDLPRGAADVPAKYKGEKWARLGVDVDNDFEAIYVVSPDKKAKVGELKSLLSDADELYLATDPDREGEAIAWHLLETLKPKVPVRRMVFHEITEAAIQAAAADTRELDKDLVDAQETRRILDRLYGYEVSPVLWKKVMPRLSAGRVQSVATRVIVQRERERMAFRSAEYWDIAAKLDAGGQESANPSVFGARLVAVNGSRVASGRDFGSDGQLKTASGVTVLDSAYAHRLADSLNGVDFAVSSVESKPYTRKPYAPFMTSTLQQEAARKLRFTSERTMRVAQRLYENGYITYMRTDSTTLSDTAITAARAQATQLYGAEYVSPTPRQYTRKVKNAQEAHEAIRPSGDTFMTPGQVHSKVDNDEFRLYELIWQRTVASQMQDARGTTMTVRVTGVANSGEECVFSTSGRTITFAGFLKAYVESVDEEAGGQSDDAESRLPVLTEGQAVTAVELTPDGHTTNPPPRFTEASLIKTLEELGIGRPSTYASIIKTILDRGYVYKRGSALVPSWVAFAVIGLLEAHFGRLVDFDFTAAMEDDLDAIAGGREQRGNWLSSFYFGGENAAEGSVARAGGLKRMVGDNLDGIDAREVNSIKLFSDDEGRDVNVRVGKFGPYLERMIVNPDDPQGDPVSQRANLPDELPPDELTLEVVEKLFSTPQEGRSLGVDPVSGHEIVAKEGRFGPYVTEVLPEPAEEPEPKKGAKKAEKPKPRTGSLFKSMDLESITLDDALKLLSLPRVVGADPTSGDEITAQNGRYGPYLKKGTDSRSLTGEDQIFTVTLEDALKIYAEPKRRGGQSASAPPLRELGLDSATEKPMVIKDGRFGPYVTDGETNASLRKGDEVESITDARASELLADRRARGPVKKVAKKTAAKKAPAKKAAAKKATATKVVKKAATKKAAAKTADGATTKKAAAKKAPAKKASATKS
ncbi:type I DNA topoisomerase [Nocardia jejuensis]|uniref:type I DNA topoisomerase n=1 Tax=Nocardia jejuensis TaxID=328049 RepID=UPI00082A62FF|nr:type I DNA topoisomerase [Nocardia jejuensis]